MITLFSNRKAAIKAFTLLEVLMVVVIIGILATLALGPISAAQKRSRDAQRKNHLNLIAQGIELYYASNRTYPQCNGTLSSYPVTNDWLSAIQSYIPSISSANSSTKVPKDPKNTAVYNYRYTCPASGGNRFTLSATLENKRDAEADPSTGIYEIKR